MSGVGEFKSHNVFGGGVFCQKQHHFFYGLNVWVVLFFSPFIESAPVLDSDGVHNQKCCLVLYIMFLYSHACLLSNGIFQMGFRGELERLWSHENNHCCFHMLWGFLFCFSMKMLASTPCFECGCKCRRRNVLWYCGGEMDSKDKSCQNSYILVSQWNVAHAIKALKWLLIQAMPFNLFVTFRGLLPRALILKFVVGLLNSFHAKLILFWNPGNIFVEVGGLFSTGMIRFPLVLVFHLQEL